MSIIKVDYGNIGGVLNCTLYQYKSLNQSTVYTFLDNYDAVFYKTESANSTDYARTRYTLNGVILSDAEGETTTGGMSSTYTSWGFIRNIKKDDVLGISSGTGGFPTEIIGIQLN